MTDHEYPHPLLTVWRVLLAVPMSALLYITYACIALGWGWKTADRFAGFILGEFYD